VTALLGIGMRLKKRRQWFLLSSAAGLGLLLCSLQLDWEPLWRLSHGFVDGREHWALWAVLQLLLMLLGLTSLRRVLARQRDNLGVMTIAGLAVVGQILLGIFCWWSSRHAVPTWFGLHAAELAARVKLHMMLTLGFAGVAVAAVA